MKTRRTVITGTGSYIPTEIVPNSHFAKHQFYQPDGSEFGIPNEEITEKFKAITGIEERRYVRDDQTTSQIATIAAQRAIEDAGIDPETIDQIIFAHNFGDIKAGTIQMDVLPTLASRLKHALGIKNENCIPYDMFFGCPGWIQGVIQADAFIKSGMAKCCLVIGAETLSRVVDVHDRDSMIFADGAGASVVELVESEEVSGILACSAISHTDEEAWYLALGPSNRPEADENVRYMKMQGRKIYEYSLTHVPRAMLACLSKAGQSIKDVKKVFIHQANEKMDEAIIKRLFKGHNMPEGVMPMSIHWLGNSSVATVITLYDMVKRGEVEGQKLSKGDLILFASVGAGMNINAIAYRH
jgi:3-oxoacyl-[acyl-carrier-protein] synthase III